MHLRRASTLIAAVAVLVGLAWTPASGQEASLGGGSDIPVGSVVRVPSGATIPPIHHLFVDNPETEPIEVRFRADAPPGIEVSAEETTATVRPGERFEVPFSVHVSEGVGPDNHRVAVRLERTDLEPREGRVLNVPSVGTEFTVRVTGDAGSITVRSESSVDGSPVEGTLTVSYVDEDRSVEVARESGSELTARVSPGTYETRFLLGDRVRARDRVEVSADESVVSTLEVETVSFVLVDAEPVFEGGRLVLVELRADVQNHLEVLSGPVSIRAHVEREGRRVDTATLEELDELPLGVTGTELAYRPEGGFEEGPYSFRFELETPQFTLEAAEVPTVGESAGAIPWMAVGLGGLTVLGAAGGSWVVFRGRR